MPSLPEVTLMQWYYHLDWLESQGIAFDDLAYVHEIAIDRANLMVDPTGVTMRDLGFGSLDSVRRVAEHIGGADGIPPVPRRLNFGVVAGFNPYEHHEEIAMFSPAA